MGDSDVTGAPCNSLGVILALAEGVPWSGSFPLAVSEALLCRSVTNPTELGESGTARDWHDNWGGFEGCRRNTVAPLGASPDNCVSRRLTFGFVPPLTALGLALIQSISSLSVSNDCA